MSLFVPVRNWSWETYWLVGGFFSWIIVPWLLASTMTEDLLGVLKTQSALTLGWTYLFGVLWGFGGLYVRPHDAIPLASLSALAWPSAIDERSARLCRPLPKASIRNSRSMTSRWA